MSTLFNISRLPGCKDETKQTLPIVSDSYILVRGLKKKEKKYNCNLWLRSKQLG